ncbi:hypothetical protein HanXRQr2_Chr04g0163331 [Helianthus annuus]|uniref:Uncharacterized protein n=1 Tax=Helianthus annuus TaxID=4232 RepID=A0A251UBM2_HELAN|nr:hypothetical protein HanXRQr2_Chr04g0163331 [Helianthus annuus]
MFLFLETSYPCVRRFALIVKKKKRELTRNNNQSVFNAIDERTRQNRLSTVFYVF